MLKPAIKLAAELFSLLFKRESKKVAKLKIELAAARAQADDLREANELLQEELERIARVSATARITLRRFYGADGRLDPERLRQEDRFRRAGG